MALSHNLILSPKDFTKRIEIHHVITKPCYRCESLRIAFNVHVSVRERLMQMIGKRIMRSEWRGGCCFIASITSRLGCLQSWKLHVCWWIHIIVKTYL